MPKHNFKSLDYLLHGNDRQRLAFEEMNKLQIFKTLQPFDPVLTGTLPIGIDIPSSDLDIICECVDHNAFAEVLVHEFGSLHNFKISTAYANKLKATICEFEFGSFVFEIFGQNLPTEEQNAYRHMIKEHTILLEKGEEFRKQIIALKLRGIKTEPAFADLLGLEGDPYKAILDY